jgi:hypothetical protein
MVPAPSYFATIWVGDRAYWTCALGYGETSYVGRDILDQLSVTLDGVSRRLLVTVGGDAATVSKSRAPAAYQSRDADFALANRALADLV